MIKYLKVVMVELAKFTTVEVVHILRGDNSNIDALARLTTSKEVESLKLIPIEVLYAPRINRKVDLLRIDDEPSWMDPIRDYLNIGILPEDEVEAKKSKVSIMSVRDRR